VKHSLIVEIFIDHLSHECSRVMQQVPLVILREAQESGYFAGRPSLDIAQTDDLALI
jgi:hypothetical protein